MKLRNYYILLLTLITLSCGSSAVMDSSMKLNPGQTKSQVIKIMGNPGNRQFQGIDEAWQYCSTDYMWGTADEYVVVWFYDGKVTGVTTYTNTQGFGSCEKFYKTVRWEDKPDVIIEHKVK